MKHPETGIKGIIEKDQCLSPYQAYPTIPVRSRPSNMFYVNRQLPIGRSALHPLRQPRKVASFVERSATPPRTTKIRRLWLYAIVVCFANVTTLPVDRDLMP